MYINNKNNRFKKNPIFRAKFFKSIFVFELREGEKDEARF